MNKASGFGYVNVFVGWKLVISYFLSQPNVVCFHFQIFFTQISMIIEGNKDEDTDKMQL